MLLNLILPPRRGGRRRRGEEVGQGGNIYYILSNVSKRERVRCVEKARNRVVLSGINARGNSSRGAKHAATFCLTKLKLERTRFLLYSRQNSVKAVRSKCRGHFIPANDSQNDNRFISLFRLKNVYNSSSERKSEISLHQERERDAM